MTLSPNDIVAEFAEFVENNSCADIRDASVLPYSKDVILEAFYSLFETELDKQRLTILLSCIQLIPDFQEGVGDTPLYILGVNPKDYESISTMGDEDLATLANKIASEPNKDKREYFIRLAVQEKQVIHDRVKSIIMRKLESVTKPTPLKKPTRWKYFVPAYAASFVLLSLLKNNTELNDFPYGMVAFISIFLVLLFVETGGRFLIYKIINGGQQA